LKEKETKEPSFNVLSADFYYYEPSTYNNIGDCYKHLGLIHEAEVAYKKAIERNNKEPLYYSNLVNLYISQNRLQEAQDLTYTVIKSSIADHLTYLLLGKIFITQGNTNDAINAFHQSIQLDNKNTTAHTYLINLLIQDNQLEKAKKVLTEIISFYPDDLKLKCLTEKIHYKCGNKESALNFIQNILTSNPSDKRLYLDLGDLCIEMEEYATAIEVLERYLTTSQGIEAMVIASIATCYAKLGKLESAIFGFQTALKLDPNCNCALHNLATLKN
jgi:tetratricopeptide (TPR) repeat protein